MSVFDSYPSSLALNPRVELDRLLRLIHGVAPEGEEVITYGMQGFKYKVNTPPVLAPSRTHLSLFPLRSPIEVLRDQRTDIKTLRGGACDFVPLPVVRPKWKDPTRARSNPTPTPIPPPAPTQMGYITMGASYSSGEGIRRSIRAQTLSTDSSHPSSAEWPRQLAADEPNIVMLTHIACSGGTRNTT